jgi:hypothetical protein
MSFFKYLYYPSPATKIYKAKQIEKFIWTCGQNLERRTAVVSNFDELGNLSWSKEFSFETDLPVSFVNVVKITDGYLLAGVEENEREYYPFILKIDGNLEKVWYRTFEEIVLTERKIFLTSFFEDYFHVSFFDERSLRTKVYFYHFDGIIQMQRDVFPDYDSYFRISGMEIRGELLFLSGNEPLDDLVGESKKTGVLITLDVNLSYIDSQYYKYNSEAGFEDVLLNGLSIANNELFVFGTLPDNSQSLIFLENGGIFEYRKDPSYITNAIFGNNSILLHHGEAETSSINYNNFSPAWSKHIQLNNVKLDMFNSNDRVIIHGEEADFLGLLPDDLDSCKTTDVETISYQQSEYGLNHAKYIIEDIDTVFNEESTIHLDDFIPDTSEVCNGGGGPGDGTSVTISNFSTLNTPNFYLQATGSLGNDSTAGIHLRWAFGGELGENHLAKGNLASTLSNYNKPNDFVKIYRASYDPAIFTLDFQVPPQLVDNSQRLWVYKFNNNQRIFYVYFKNSLIYSQISGFIDPMTDPLGFIQNYGDGIIEIICRTDLFFACTPRIVNVISSSRLQLEGLSVAENNNTLPNHLSYRKTLDESQINNSTYFNAENGKKVRLKANDCFISAIDFEFYSDFIIQTNQNLGWIKINDFSLSTNTGEIVTRLEPSTGDVDNNWLRYNDGSNVRITNYHHKWQHTSQNVLDRDIKTVVEKYVSLSNQLTNPKANETITVNLANSSVNSAFQVSNNPPQPGDMVISNLDLLNIAGVDYHVARMLGLGHLDLSPEIYNGKYIYLAEYKTNDNVDIKATNKNYQLLSMSLPTGLENERLPIPVEIWKLEPGMANSQGLSNLYDINGYSFDGKKRFISIYNYEVPDPEINPVFFSNYEDYDASTFTDPVHAGLEYRFFQPSGNDPGVWVKPELSNDSQYTNWDGSNENVPILLPDPNAALYMHKQEESGTYIYATYGINWFSRSVTGGELSIVTELKPANTLLPPSGCHSFLIQHEYPPMFTSFDEQQRYSAITGDKTLVRILFDYHIYQDEQVYQLPDNTNQPDSYFINDPTSIYDDADEVMADDVEIYYRDTAPKMISAQAYDISDVVSNQFLLKIKTRDYNVPSSAFPDPNNPNIVLYADVWKSELPIGTTFTNFIGGIFQIENDVYIIHEIANGANGLDFTVYKKEVSDAMIAGNPNPTLNTSTLTTPLITDYNSVEGVFSVTENMQNSSNWGNSNPNSLKVKIGDHNWGIHRELFQLLQSNGSTEKFIQKSRGFWHDNATIEMVFLPKYEYTRSDNTVITYDPNNPPIVHQGVYKITLNNFNLPDHSQESNIPLTPSVEWHKGFVRLFTNECFIGGDPIPVQTRIPFKVVKTENIGTNATGDVVLYIVDENFIIEEDQDPNSSTYLDPIYVTATSYNPKPTDPVLGANMEVNYYPSYKVYLYKNSANNLTQSTVLPTGNDLVKYSVFGFKSVDNDTLDMQGNTYKSKFSIPTVLIGQAVIEPEIPEQPTGSTFATRPDKFGKSTYSLLTNFTHKPYSVMFLRTDNNMLLHALYKEDTVQAIKMNLKALGDQEEPFFNDRWKNFIDFNNLLNNGNYTPYPPQVPPTEQYAFPLPDNEELFLEISAFINFYNTQNNTAYSISSNITSLNQTIFNDPGAPYFPFINFVKDRFQRCFLPLTEIPVIYNHVKSYLTNNYRPQNRKQNIRDTNGYLLPPTDSGFDMAPMMTVMSPSSSSTPQILFTDFTLDGTSDNFYFYASREIGSKMKMSDFSPILGPIRLVNSNPAEPPKIMSLLPQLDNISLGIIAKVRVEVNAYPEVQHINKISLYRAMSKLDADSILSMKHIKTVDIADVEIDTTNNCWIIYDEFDDLQEKPYGDLLFYRVVVSRKVEYSETDYFASGTTAQTVVEQAPSLPSKVTVSTLVENYNPPTPELLYHAEPVNGNMVESVILDWPKVCYKGQYHLYKMSNEGNWKEIARVLNNEKNTSKAHLYLLEVDPVTLESTWEFNETFDVVNDTFYLPLQKLNMDPLSIIDADGNILYHHFKVVAENTSNMFSNEEKILTIYKENTWADIAGISSDGTDGMIIQGTFIIR